jgi:hypothetical protein
MLLQPPRAYPLAEELVGRRRAALVAVLLRLFFAAFLPFRIPSGFRRRPRSSWDFAAKPRDLCQSQHTRILDSTSGPVRCRLRP